VRIATFNVLHGRPRDDCPPASRATLGTMEAPLAEAVASLDADILALQELDRFQQRSGDVDQARVAAEAMGAMDWRYASALHGRAMQGVGWVRDQLEPGLRMYGPQDAAVPDCPSHGIALLTRLPVIAWRARRLAPAPTGLPLRVVGRRGLTMVRDQPRAAIAGVLQGPRGPYTVVATHLSFVPGWNLGQLAALHRWIADQPRPHVLLGDLNLIGPLPRALLAGAELADGVRQRGRLEHRWHDLARIPTYPAQRPAVQFDRVLAAGVPTAAVHAVHAPITPISDHRPVVVDLRVGAA